MEQFVTTFSATGRLPKETCRQCRFRKVRCDGVHGEKGCGDCDRLKFACSFVSQPAPPTPTAVSTTDEGSADHHSPTSDRPVERRRTSKACAACRHQKVRCSGGSPCLACKKKGVTCVYGSDGRRRGSRIAISSTSGTPTESTFAGIAESVSGGDDASVTSLTPTTPGTTVEPPPNNTHSFTGPAFLPPDIQVLVEFYFANVYPLPSYAFLHPQTTIRQCSEGQLEPSLSYAISAVASHHQGSPQRRQHVELAWIQAAEDIIWKHLESPSVPRLQALLLVILYRVETGAFPRAFMLSGLAARGAAALRLNHERTMGVQGHGSTVSQEVRRRLMWSLKLVERYFSIGLPEFELCPVDCIYLELPCWERDFSDSRSECTKPTLQSCDFGSYHHFVRLEMLRRDLMKLTRSLALCDTFPQLPSVMRDFEQHLTRISADLPNGTTLTTERISQLLDSPWLPRQILVHLSFHQCQCDLYRLLLRGYRESAPTAVLDTMEPELLVKAEQLCLQHATAIVDILATLNQLSHQAQPLEFDTAICGYHATRLLLFIAQSSTSSTKPREEWALSRAELCLASLRRFFSTSQLVKPVLEEMKRAITVFGSRADASTPSRLASPGPTVNGAKDPDAGLSPAARVRQRLAIHSLLRQADFTDEDETHHERSTTKHASAAAPLPLPSPPQGKQGINSLDNPRRPSSTFLISPGTSPEGESWQFGWLNNGDLVDRWDPETQPGSGTGAGPPNFSFPWLQRGEGPPSIGGAMTR
ncbi:hypothetical protein VP1G_08620 [Cytospora mali]|uniref:Zn(2)-C6 fungal-type domain-containing protein n=1 Tax=Cytospora mali TaxID=578113 RepID=A0A194VC45_CYTMA|nr:hypothetical protein VP1G_08620 [Valsa mali var. pyri (nom. inval.)]